MVNKVKVLLIFLLLALTISFICAETTKIIVKASDITHSNYKITLGIYDVNGNHIDSQIEDTKGTGQAIFSFNSSSRQITFSTHVSLNKIPILTKSEGSYPDYPTGITITLDALQTTANTTITNNTNTTIPAVNSTINNTSNSTNITARANLITANAIANATQEPKESLGEKAGKIWNAIDLYVYYVLGAIVVLIIIYFIIRFIIKYKSGHPSYSDKKIHSTEDVKVSSDPRIEKALGEAQRKIKEAQDTIDKINHRESKVADAEKRFEEAKRELERAKKGF